MNNRILSIITLHDPETESTVYRVGITRNGKTHFYSRKMLSYPVMWIERMLTSKPVLSTFFGVSITRFSFDFTKG